MQRVVEHRVVDGRGRVVDEDVDGTAEGVDRLGDDAGAVVSDAMSAAISATFAPNSRIFVGGLVEAAGQVVVLVDRAGGDRDVGTLGGEPQRGGRADAPARAGDDHVHPLELLAHGCLLRRRPYPSPSHAFWPAIAPQRGAIAGQNGRRWDAAAASAVLGERGLALPRGGVDRVLVELGDHVLAERLDRLDRDLDRHRRREHAEHELVGADVGVAPCTRLDDLVGRAHAHAPGVDAGVELLGRGLGDEVGPRRAARRLRERVEVAEHEAVLVAARHVGRDVA